ncbi:MAG: hypothetical protein H0U71_03380 [Gammaproteobacteria bacterium]|nr:hypothetical protein [Gammaproteobacteria bacterium]
MNNHIEQLLEILFDPIGRIDERDDAAIYLAKYPSNEILEKLVIFASNSEENQIILASVGESIGEIMVALNKFDPSILGKLAATAKIETLGVISGKKPEWLR